MFDLTWKCINIERNSTKSSEWKSTLLSSQNNKVLQKEPSDKLDIDIQVEIEERTLKIVFFRTIFKCLF